MLAVGGCWTRGCASQSAKRDAWACRLMGRSRVPQLNPISQSEICSKAFSARPDIAASRFNDIPHRSRSNLLSETSPTGQIRQSVQGESGRPAVLVEIFRLTCRANQCFGSARLTRERGVSRSSRTRGGMRWTRQPRHADELAGWVTVRDFGARRRTMLRHAVKACGPDARCWRQVGGGVANSTEDARPSIRR